MKKSFLTVLTLLGALLVLVNTGVSQQKPWTEWTKADAEKILNHSAWGQTQTDTSTREMVYTPTSGRDLGTSNRSENIRGVTDRQVVATDRVVQGATNQALPVNYHIRLLSAKPVRQAFMRVIELTQKKPDKDLLTGLTAFVERDFREYIVVAVTFDSSDGRYSGPVGQSFASATSASLKNNTYLERQDGQRLFLSDYQAPMNDGLGAKFVFPRMDDNLKNFLDAGSGSVRFYSEVGAQIKLNVTFKISEMMYSGQLEY
jgi:hypothetical protein